MELSNISDTAFWVAQYRADETRRPDAIFKDPYAVKLLGEKGSSVQEYMDPDKQIAWSMISRTYLFDKAILEEIAEGVDMVICLASGLDARPYRLDLPAELKWVEIDLPEILQYKTEVLANEKPKCKLERIALDLSDIEERQKVFDRLCGEADMILVVSEGLLIYLSPEEVISLAKTLARPHVKTWITEVVSPGLLKMMMKRSGDKLSRANAPFKFGPEEGSRFFEPYGWAKHKVYSIIKTAAKFKRIGFFMRLLSRLPERDDKLGSAPWSGICVLRNAQK